jgi:hypothetical protein
MPPNVDAMVRAGIRSYRAGRKAEARTLLEKAVEIDEHNEQAWLWLSAVVDSPEDQRTCLENVLFINPENDSARQGLQMLTGGTPPPPPSTPMQAPPPTSGGFGPPPTPAFTEPDTADQPAAWEVPPTPTSSASSIFTPGNEATAADYDQWMAGLNLGSSADDEPPSDKPKSFPAVEDILGEGFFDDEEEESPAVVAPSSPMPGDDLRQQLHDDAFPSDVFANGPFVADMLDIDLDDQQESEPARPVVTSPALRMSPGAENVNLRKSPAPIDADLTQIADGGLFVVDSDEDDFDSIDYDSNLQQDPIGYFQYIPRDISATRLPGTIERYPLPVMAGLIILIVANVGAIGWLISNLLG